MKAVIIDTFHKSAWAKKTAVEERAKILLITIFTSSKTGNSAMIDEYPEEVVYV